MPNRHLKKERLLLVDDEPGIVFSLTDCLTSSTLSVDSAGSGREALACVKRQTPDVVLLDVRLPDQSGLDVFEQIHALEPRVPVIIMTAYASTDTAIDAMRRGAFDYLLKPVDVALLRATVDKAREVSRLSRIPAMLESDSDDPQVSDRILGHSPQMQEVYKSIGRMAPLDSTVLILGESGTGKELVARAIYHYSQRASSPFLAINCAALPEPLLESELFGHEQGAFTGAVRRRIGKFEQMNGGTIFLDEIGDMSAAIQAKALRLLQDQQFERVGGSETVRTNVRVIAATNRHLSKLVEEGRFRQDLLYRLNGLTINLPPLRDRKDDLPLLTQHFIQQFNRELRKSIAAISPDAESALARHDWPGNVREFRSAIQYAMVHATSDVITSDCLPQSCLLTSSSAEPHSGAVDEFGLQNWVRDLLKGNATDVYARVQERIDRIVLSTVLDHTQGHQAQAAQILGMARNTLRSRLRTLGLLNEKSGGDDGGGTAES